jgi:hypothetical protein
LSGRDGEVQLVEHGLRRVEGRCQGQRVKAR